MSGTDWESRLATSGVENWKRAVTARLETWDADRDAWIAWSKTPRGRVTLALRRIHNLPGRLRFGLALLIYPGDLQRELDDR